MDPDPEPHELAVPEHGVALDGPGESAVSGSRGRRLERQRRQQGIARRNRVLFG